METQQIKALIEAGLACEATVEGDGRHFNATVISAEFMDKGTLERHRLVYGALGEKMGTDIHALSLITRTPAEHEVAK